MRNERTSNQLRCFCSRKPLLATYGLDAEGKAYIHVRIFKQQRIFGEVVVSQGTVHIHCRECLRWHKIEIREPGSLHLIKEADAPTVIAQA